MVPGRVRAGFRRIPHRHRTPSLRAVSLHRSGFFRIEPPRFGSQRGPGEIRAGERGGEQVLLGSIARDAGEVPAGRARSQAAGHDAVGVAPHERPQAPGCRDRRRRPPGTRRAGTPHGPLRLHGRPGGRRSPGDPPWRPERRGWNTHRRDAARPSAERGSSARRCPRTSSAPGCRQTAGPGRRARSRGGWSARVRWRGCARRTAPRGPLLPPAETRLPDGRHPAPTRPAPQTGPSFLFGVPLPIRVHQVRVALDVDLAAKDRQPRAGVTSGRAWRSFRNPGGVTSICTECRHFRRDDTKRTRGGNRPR
ncbi:hypothetical protein SAMN05421854_10540 [Amycolatopsis rubida]|uniref:Uncharacterized protein n=1 Tax=Amycolatopsis rubida TaxID=112413 RepID=A0A1I5PR95_9PSEU|nr:hypothetical protein SAMN05421854_10540 [Amycolatopsis rubida]